VKTPTTHDGGHMFIEWIKAFGASITVMDRNGEILYMNDAAGQVFEKFGGIDMIGSNVDRCHEAPAMGTIKEMMENNAVNVYTIEKNGQKKMVYQAPWYQNRSVAGLVSISMAIPEEMPHFKRT